MVQDGGVNEQAMVSKNGPRRRRRFSPDQIRQWVADHEGSGLSAAAYAREHGLCYEVFRRWVKECRCPGPRGAGRPAFQAVPLSALLGPGWAAEITLPQGPTVRVSAQAAPGWIGELLSVLRAC